MHATTLATLTLARDLAGVPEEREAQALLARLAAGDREPLGALYDLFAADLHALALWRTGRREDADDVVQDVFVKLASTGARLAGVGRPRAYLLSIAHRAAVDRLRKRRAVADADPATFLEAPPFSPERALDAARVSSALARLAGPQREAIWLHHFAELTFREIGQVTGVPLFTAASRYRLGIRRLQALLGERA
jgi:RNA polymerase sigma-70 factor (ECF subfamily)